MGKRGSETFLSGVAGALAAILVATAAGAACRDDQVELRGDWGQARFTVELADDPEERSRGLMFRESLSASQGMLFLYPDRQPLTFWMRNTLIELDMIFIEEGGLVTHVHSRAQPHDLTPISGGQGIAVLEIRGGLAEALGIAPGSEIRHPAFGSDARWPC